MPIQPKVTYLCRHVNPSLDGTLCAVTRGTKGCGFPSKSLILRSESPTFVWTGLTFTAICSVSSSVEIVRWGSSIEIDAPVKFDNEESTVLSI